MLQAYRSIAVFICSNVKHRDRRRHIRTTWGRVLRPKPIFILGLSTDNEVDNEMALEEAHLYQDVIIENFHESYQNLTLKTLFALKHFLRLTPNETYFLKIDDDVFLNTYQLDHIMEKYQTTPGIIGHLESQRYAHRDKESKWFTPRWMLSKEALPNFINGPAYLISGSLVKKIYEKALETPLITLEDVFLTGLVSNELLNIPLYNNIGFEDYYSIDSIFNRDCFYRSVFTIHRMTLMEQIYELWDKLKENHEPCWDI
uniref:Hexosyltransferase n=1 Tax=Culicoides sonorensis TaxID=179676 RepID=A0A336MN17_CULSO